MRPGQPKILIGMQFRPQLEFLIEWINFLEVIDGPIIATEWLYHPNTVTNMATQIKNFKHKQESKTAKDTSMPDTLKVMKNYIDWWRRIAS